MQVIFKPGYGPYPVITLLAENETDRMLLKATFIGHHLKTLWTPSIAWNFNNREDDYEHDPHGVHEVTISWSEVKEEVEEETKEEVWKFSISSKEGYLSNRFPLSREWTNNLNKAAKFSNEKAAYAAINRTFSRELIQTHEIKVFDNTNIGKETKDEEIGVHAPSHAKILEEVEEEKSCFIISNKKGYFTNDVSEHVNHWQNDIDKATIFNTKKLAIDCIKNLWTRGLILDKNIKILNLTQIIKKNNFNTKVNL